MRSDRPSRQRRTQDFDDIDRQILAILEADGRRPTAEIARAVGLTGPGTAERISRMRDKGIIKGFTVKLDLGRLGLHVSAFVEFDPHSNADGAGIAAVAGHPAVRSCLKVTGPAMLMLVVSARDGDELHNVLLDFAKHGTTKTAVILSSELAEIPLFAERPRDVVAALLRRRPSKGAPVS
jgi:Lrp/AsnC family transcriptional regulator, leucine-responsive regulatory protein